MSKILIWDEMLVVRGMITNISGESVPPIITVCDGGNSMIRLKVDTEPCVYFSQEDSLKFLSWKAHRKQEFTYVILENENERNENGRRMY
jgi:hypothetical protein